MKATGRIKIEEGLELNNPTLEINSVIYNWSNSTVSIECLFNEEGSIYKHSRSYNFDLKEDREYTALDIENFVSSLFTSFE